MITLGDARFGQLEGGPFDGRCYPLFAARRRCSTCRPTGRPDARRATVRYVLRDGRYRFAGESIEAMSAA